MKYIGITIGPIYDTIHKAQKTREIWGASYIFSFMCKEILKKIKGDNFEILLPNPIYLNDSKPGVGLYPDRILLKTKEKGSFNEINKILKEVKESVAEQLWNEINKFRFTFTPFEPHVNYFKTQKDELKDFFYNYFKTYAIEADEQELCFVNNENEKIGVVKSLNLYLDNAELMPTLAHFDPDPFFVLLNFINHSFLVRDAFHSDYKDGFPSLTEISSSELQFIKDDQNNYLAQNDIRRILKNELEDSKEENSKDFAFKYDDGALSEIFKISKLKKFLRTYHKYIAIVYADGDNMGKLIGTLNDNKEIQNFSKDLIDFAIKSNKILAGERFTQNSRTNWGYGAAPVYIGGDDLVFFAPVASINEKGEFMTIFDLISEIDVCFNEIFNKPIKKDEKGNVIEFEKYKDITDSRPCLSYGVSISFYKFPLREAFEQSKQLMINVKNDNFKTRNRIHFALHKHSGQTYKGIIDKNFKEVFKKYLELLKNKGARSLTGDKSEQFINSIFNNIQKNKGQYLDKNIQNLEELFNHNFNEKIHNEFRPYLEDVRNWVEEMLQKQDYKKGNIYEEDTLETIGSLLKFIHFIRDNEFRI